ncbi:beta-glucosidase [Nesterenkonia rhizosphaerae]|uniref:Glycoside hydrolase family 3 C-terminal domain-containing protein n=1 Tax=Nesterenkonia rhizosphaerae TaxID=1348272 RepID=A0ABP9FY57_9MICC
MSVELTPLEKAALLSGEDVWHTRGVPRAGIAPIVLSDGPHGIRRQSGDGDHLGLHASEPATCFPTAATVANSWDPQLGEQIGQALGAEAVSLGVDVVLGPGLNIKRSPLCGRNFEYFSEDPLLSGRLAAAYVRGIQSAGVGACPKHFAANSQETLRMIGDSIVDERTLREIYLRAFEIVVTEAAPQVIMSAYNKINGTYAHENYHLLTEILRDQWGFDGVVVSDWGGSNDAAAAVRAGGTLEMPSPGWDSVHQLLQALESGELDEADLDARVQEIVTLIQQLAETVPSTPGPIDEEAHHQLARRAAAESAVLLKNESIVGDAPLLPLRAGVKTAVVGDFALTPRYQGAGSSLVNPTRLRTPAEVSAASGLDIVGIAQGFRRDGAEDAALAAEATALAAKADVVLLWMGLDELSESEGLDRSHMRLPDNQIQLLKALKDTGTPVAVVLSGGAAVESSWMKDADAVLHGYLAGQAGAEALFDVITGLSEPGGRLAESWPESLQDTSTAGRFPALGREVHYLEGPLVGYRWHTSAQIAPAFPFGFGLSYTSFDYTDVQADSEQVTVTVTNTGDRAGADVVQVYIRRTSDSAVLRAQRQLAGFFKVHLQPGESQQVSIPLGRAAFQHWDLDAEDWRVESGSYEVIVAAHSEDTASCVSVEVIGDHEARSGGQHQLAELIEKVHAANRAGAAEQPESKERIQVGLNHPLAELSRAKSPLARGAAAVLGKLLARSEAKGKPNLNVLFLNAMPVRGLAKMSGGAMSLEMAQQAVRIFNGHHLSGTAGLLRETLRQLRRQRRLRQSFITSSTAGVTNHQEKA